MSDVFLRTSPSGPRVDISDTLAPVGTVLGLPLDASSEGYAVPLEGGELGAIQRFAQYSPLALPAGTHDNVSIPDGTAVFDVTPTGTVTIPGVVMAARNNTGIFLLRKSGLTGTLSIPNNASSNAANRFLTPSAIPFNFDSGNDSIRIWRFNTRWQPIARMLAPTGQSPSLDGAPALASALRVTFAATGAAADDVTLSLAIPLGAVIYDAICQISTAVGASTAIVRSAVGGGGVALTGTFDTATTGTRRNDATSLATIARGSSLFLRRSSGNIVGTITLYLKPAP